MPHKPPVFRPRHAGIDKQSERARRRAYEKTRATPAERGYDADWRRVRAEHLAAHPFCAHCGSGGDLQVDHVESIAKRPDLRLDPSNLRTLCRSCHGRVSAAARHGKPEPAPLPIGQTLRVLMPDGTTVIRTIERRK
jgi:5-methylcytosine-specific restriction endonuclease McrA